MVDMAHVIEAFHLVFAFETMAWILLGVVVGVGVGAMPGLSPAPAIALLLPLTFTLSLPAALGLLIGVYKGGVYGGAISAISFATPGTADAATTVFDGHKLMQRGQGKKALHISLYSSVTADVTSDIITIILAPTLALIALSFGPSERLWLIVLAVTLLGALSGDHFAKGMLAAAIGLFLATIGSDPVTMVPRNTFGQWWLMDGIHLVPLIIGLFAVATMLEKLVELIRDRAARSGAPQIVPPAFGKSGEPLTFREYLSCWKEMLIGTGIGSFVGILPGLGATVGAFLSYGVAKQMSPEKNIGSGRLEGVAASEAGNNATCGPTLIPLLAFGIPGSTIAALLGGALAIQGVQAGPRMFELYPVAIYALFIILLVSNVFNLFIGRFFAGIYARLAVVPPPLLVPVVLIMALFGAYAYQNNHYDVYLVLGFGLLGYFMKVFNLPVAPLIITFILAPLAEESLRRALMINRGDWMAALFTSNLAIALAVFCVVVTIVLARLQVNQRVKTLASVRSDDGEGGERPGPGH
ncbi:tripartite tricarboxylate transporter permease [Alkalilacustris brevis]|uniref:tripartite tricarboxylate transporter permease n=1 Tax=Alkalilacustris brevis TaxID=2026338 RepID=UPI000E0D712F|nr:tripartite tricarboxylate transporter permease [Alkalilacustris brevis]